MLLEYKYGEELKMKRLLIVVDYQNDFVNGSLGFNGAEKLEKRIVELIKEYKSNDDEII